MRSGSYGSLPIRPSSISRRIVRSERTTAAILRARPARTGRADCDKVRDPVSMLFPPIDPNERFRSRRAVARRRKRLRRGALIGALLVVVALLGVGAQFVGGVTQPAQVEAGLDRAATTATGSGPRPLPVALRGG